jgi:hypothetical protein
VRPTRALNAPIRPGSGPSTICGRTSATANSSLTSKPLDLARRLLLLAPAKRLPAANGSSTSKPHALARRLLRLAPARRPLPLTPAKRLLQLAHAGKLPSRRPPEPSSCGLAATASTSGLPARLHGASNVRQTSHACATKTNAVHVRHLPTPPIDSQLP